MQIEWIEDQEYFQDWGKRRFTAKMSDRVQLFVNETKSALSDEYEVCVVVWHNGRNYLGKEYTGTLEYAKLRAESLAIERVPAWIEAQRKALNESMEALNQISEGVSSIVNHTCQH